MSALDAEINRSAQTLRDSGDADAAADVAAMVGDGDAEIKWLRLLEVAVREKSPLGEALALAQLDKIRGAK